MEHSGTISRSAFLALGAAAFVGGANLRMLDALLPSLAEDFGVPVTAAAVVVTAFTLSYGLFQVVHGPLGDRLGKLRVVGAATVLAGLGSLGSGFAPTLASLTWLRFATGIGGAAIVPLSIAWIGDSSGYATRQIVLGRFVGFMLLGQVLGPALGGALAQFLGWREVFHVLAAVFLAVGAVVLVVGRSSASAPAQAARGNVLRAYAQIVRSPWVRTVTVAVFLEGAFFFGVFAYAGAYLKERFGLPYATVGAVLGSYGFGAFTYSLLVKRLRSVMGERGFVRLSAAILLAGFAALPLLPVWQAAIPLFAAIGFGFYLLHNTLQTKATEMAPEARGMAVSVFALSLFVGQSSGVPANGLLIDAIGYGGTFAGAGILLTALALWFAGRLSVQARAR